MKNLLAKYGQLIPLSDDEKKVLEGLASVAREYEAGRDLVASELDEPDQLYIVKSGRLFASLRLPSGERAITRLYFAGDIVGTANMPFERATQTLTVSAPSELYFFPRRILAEAFVSLPRIAAIFYTFAALENAILNDRLVSIGRSRGKVRIASLILEIAARQNLPLASPTAQIEIGLTQVEIGDAVGLTSIQVNRILRELEEEGVIKRQQKSVEVRDVDRLTQIGRFRNRYEDLDLDWFTDL